MGVRGYPDRAALADPGLLPTATKSGDDLTRYRVPGVISGL